MNMQHRDCLDGVESLVPVVYRDIQVGLDGVVGKVRKVLLETRDIRGSLAKVDIRGIVVWV